jgi:hypothetical protein
VPREHAEVPVGSRDLDFVHPFVDERAIGRHDLELQVVR